MKRRAMSLMEVALALAVLSVIAIACLGVLPIAWRSVRASEHQLSANARAQEILDECSAGSFERLKVGTYTGASAPPLGPLLVDRTLEDQVVLQAELEIAAVAGPQAPRLRLLTLRIRWQERGQTRVVARHRRVARIAR